MDTIKNLIINIKNFQLIASLVLMVSKLIKIIPYKKKTLALDTNVSATELTENSEETISKKITLKFIFLQYEHSSTVKNTKNLNTKK